MTTIINTPGTGDSSDSGVSIVIGVLLAIVVIAIFIIYGLPALREGTPNPEKGSIDINLKLPAKEIIVPDSKVTPAN